MSAARSAAGRPRFPTWRIATIFGVPVHLSSSWLVLAVILVLGYRSLIGPRYGREPLESMLLAAAFAVLLTLGVLLHELGHALTARAFGATPRRIDLHLMGGHTRLDSTRLSPGASAVVSLSGPLISLGLCALCWAVLTFTDLLGWPALLLYLLYLANGLLGVFNLLPALPLDGGQALSALIWWATGRRRWGLRSGAVLGLAGSLVPIPWALLTGHGGRPVTLLVAAAVSWFLITGALGALREADLLARCARLHLREFITPAVWASAEETPAGLCERTGADAPAVIAEGASASEPRTAGEPRDSEPPADTAARRCRGVVPVERLSRPDRASWPLATLMDPVPARSPLLLRGGSGEELLSVLREAADPSGRVSAGQVPVLVPSPHEEASLGVVDPLRIARALDA